MNDIPLPREKPVADNIKAMLDAGSNLIILTSREEACVERIVKQVSRDAGKSLYIWSSTRGFHKGIEDNLAVTVDQNPLDAVSKLRDAAGSIALLKDFHHFFEDTRCIRGVKDILLAAPDNAPQLVLAMPPSEVPPELLKDAAYVEVPLPDGKELRMLLDESLSTVGKSVSADDAERASVAAAGLTAAQAMRVYKLAANNLPDTPTVFIEKILGEKRSLARQALALEFLEPSVTFEHVGGLELLKKWLGSRAGAFTTKAREYGLPMPRGLLLLGVQGCGKSLSAKSVAKLWKLPLLRLDLSRIDPVSGEVMLMQALRTSETVAPAVLWIDEIEKGFGKAGGTNTGVSLRALSAFVTWLQEKTSPVYVVATANSISNMPPELLRKGRFDEIFFVDLPSKMERIEIFNIHLSKRHRNPEDFDIERHVSHSEGFSGAEIEAIVVSGMFEAFSKNRELNDDDLKYSVDTTIPLSTTMEEEIQLLRDWARGRARPASLDTKLSDLLTSPVADD